MNNFFYFLNAQRVIDNIFHKSRLLTGSTGAVFPLTTTVLRTFAKMIGGKLATEKLKIGAKIEITMAKSKKSLFQE